MDDIPNPDLSTGRGPKGSSAKGAITRHRALLLLVGVVIVVVLTAWFGYRGYYRESQRTLYQQYLRENSWQTQLQLKYGKVKPLILEINGGIAKIEGTPYRDCFALLDSYSERIAARKDSFVLDEPSSDERGQEATAKVLALLDAMTTFVNACRRQLTADMNKKQAEAMMDAAKEAIARFNQGTYEAGPIFDAYKAEAIRQRKEWDEYWKAYRDHLKASSEWEGKALLAQIQIGQLQGEIKEFLSEPKKLPRGLNLKFAEAEFLLGSK